MTPFTLKVGCASDSTSLTFLRKERFRKHCAFLNLYVKAKSLLLGIIMSPHASTFSGSLNYQYSPSTRFSSFLFGSSRNWMALFLKYMLRTLSCSSILQGQEEIVSYVSKKLSIQRDSC